MRTHQLHGGPGADRELPGSLYGTLTIVAWGLFLLAIAATNLLG